MHIYKIVTLILCIVMLSSTAVMAQTDNQSTFQLKGYVWTRQKCPSYCPPDAACKPCIWTEGIVIVDTNDFTDTTKLKGTFVATKETDKFAVKDNCSLLVKSDGVSNFSFIGQPNKLPQVALVKIESCK